VLKESIKMNKILLVMVMCAFSSILMSEEDYYKEEDSDYKREDNEVSEEDEDAGYNYTVLVYATLLIKIFTAKFWNCLINAVSKLIDPIVNAVMAYLKCLLDESGGSEVSAMMDAIMEVVKSCAEGGKIVECVLNGLKALFVIIYNIFLIIVKNFMGPGKAALICIWPAVRIVLCPFVIFGVDFFRCIRVKMVNITGDYI